MQQLVTNDCVKLADGQVLYTVACREDGGVLDDLLVYRRGPERFLLVVNAANSDKLAAWVRAHAPRGLARDASADFAQLALQGPGQPRDPRRLPARWPPPRPALAGLGFYHFVEFALEGAPVILSRTGYTGELGFELYLPPALATPVAEALMAAGRARGLKPAGLGARDTLRFEASYCLYGHELNETTDPFEAGLFWLVKLDKGDFIGRDALRVRKDDPQARRLVGLALPGRKIARQGFGVLAEQAARRCRHERQLRAHPRAQRRDGPGGAALRGERGDAPRGGHPRRAREGEHGQAALLLLNRRYAPRVATSAARLSARPSLRAVPGRGKERS